MDILEKLGVDFNTGTLENTLHWYVHNYVESEGRFHEALNNLREAYMVKETPVIAKKFIFPYHYSDVQEVVDFYTEVKAYISEMESDDWIFYRMEEIMEDFNDDPYEDFEDLRKVIYIHAYVKSDTQPTTHEQELAMAYFESTKRDLENSKVGLEYRMREFK